MNAAHLRAMREELEKAAAGVKQSEMSETARASLFAAGGAGLALPVYIAEEFGRLPRYSGPAASALGAGLGMGLHYATRKNNKTAGQVGGALLGTAAGLEGGKAVARRFDKTAAEGGSIVESLPEQGTQSPEEEGPPPPPPPIDMSQVRKKLPPHPALTAGKTLAGLGIGMGAGYAGMKGIDYALEKTRGHGLPSSKLMWAIPAATAALGMAYPYMHQATVDKMRKDHLDRQEAKRGR